MSVMNILTAPDPILKEVCQQVKQIDDKIRSIMDNMLETMYHNNGVGLAANQVGILQRIIVLDLGNDDDLERPNNFYPLFMINPVIVNSSPITMKAKEGCLSVTNYSVEVNRSTSINVEYCDYHGRPQKIETTGWLAVAIQHEVDHLNGKTLLDYLSPVKRDTVIRKLSKLKKYA